MNGALAAVARTGAVMVLAATALTGVAGPAAAEDPPRPDLSISFDRNPVAEIGNSGTAVGVYVHNKGQAPATQVRLALDVSALTAQVEVTVPEYVQGCTLDNKLITCDYGALQPGQIGYLNPLVLARKPGAAPGGAGTVAANVTAAEQDANPADNTTSFPVTIVASGPDLAAYVDDLNTAADPVGPGDKRPLPAAVVNLGDSTANAITMSFALPDGATFGEQYQGCTYRSRYPAGRPAGYAYGPGEVTCVYTEPLPPGAALLLINEQTGESIFTVLFGKNLPGPEQASGTFKVGLAESTLTAPDGRRAGGGRSFTEAVSALQAKLAAADGAKGDGADDGTSLRSAVEEADPTDNLAEFAIFTKPNKFDVAVTTKAITTSATTGTVGDTVDLTYTVVNNGPSDGGGPIVEITAPTGTVLLPTKWCHTAGTQGQQQAESQKLRCEFAGVFPSTASGYGKKQHTVKLKIKSTPGTNGTVVANSRGPSTESKPANNTARIVFTAAGQAGGGEGLPITGTSIVLIAGAGAGILALGVLLLVISRRRRVELPTAGDGDA